ncbi:DinB family protein [Kribbella sp. NPDC050281]|uniref:DinB family protein n=1 Tax=Kribbella sp. NPDC050281 TaxID=3155515 RepID=UPI0034088367
MTGLDEQGRPLPPFAGNETETIVGFLEYQRATFAWKCSGLDAAGLRATVGVSTMTLGGMLKHVAFYEDHWFSYCLRGNERQAMWNDDYFDADPDWEWNSAADDSPGELQVLWQDAVARSRDLLSETLADGGLDRPAGRTRRDGTTPSARWIVMHMIEEYARHNGHADLIRESIDGHVGE